MICESHLNVFLFYQNSLTLEQWRLKALICQNICCANLNLILCGFRLFSDPPPPTLSGYFSGYLQVLVDLWSSLFFYFRFFPLQFSCRSTSFQWAGTLGMRNILYLIKAKSNVTLIVGARCHPLVTNEQWQIK